MNKLPLLAQFSVFTLAYGPAFLLGLVAIIPGTNFLYSGHGGPAWLLLPLALPFAIAVLIAAIQFGPVAERSARQKLALYSLIAYAPLSLLMAAAGAYSIRSTFGLPVDTFEFWTVFMSPLWLLFLP